MAPTIKEILVTAAGITNTPLQTDADVAQYWFDQFKQLAQKYDDLLNTPDLLSAAKDALESLRRLPDSEGAFRITCIGQLEKAIAKAEGRAS